MHRVAGRLVFVALLALSAATSPSPAQDTKSSTTAIPRLVITRPVEVSIENSAQFPWLMGLVDAYIRLRFSGRDDFDVITYDATAQAVPGYTALEKTVSEDAYFKAAKSLGGQYVLFHKYEYAEKEMTIQYYVELIALPDRQVVSSFEKVVQLRTIAIELDDAVLKLCEQMKRTPSDRATKFFEKYLVGAEVGKLRGFGQTVAQDFYSVKPDPTKTAKRYAETARESKDMPIGSWMAGRAYTRLGQYREALDMYRAFRDVFTTYGPVYTAMAEAYRLSGQHTQAVEAARTARSMGFEPTSILVEQLRGLDALGQKDDAYKVALEVLTRNPMDVYALYFVVRWRVSEGRFDEGLKMADQLLGLDPNHGGAQLEKGRALVGLKKAGEAIMPLTQSAVLLPKDPAPQIELGNIYYERKEFGKAAGHFAEACRLKTDTLDLFLKAAESYELAKQLKDAVKILQVIEPRHPDDLRLNAKLGLLQYNLKDTAGARAHLEKRVKSRVDDSLVFLALGDIYTVQLQYMKAINTYEQALPLVKDKNRYRLVLADLFLRKKEPNNALSYLEQIISEAPTYPSVYKYFGDAHRDAGTYDKAIENYKKERQARGDDPYLQEQIAALYFKTEKYKDAEVECQRLAKVDAKNAYAYYRLSVIALKSKNATLAEEYLNKAMKLGEADEDMYYRLGTGYADVARWDAAERSFKKCIEKNAKRYEAWAGLGNAQLKAGKDSIAAETFMDVARFERDEYREYSADAGRLFEKLKLPQKAVTAYDFYLGRKNFSEDVALRQGRLEFANKNYEAVHRLLGGQMMKDVLGEADNMLLAQAYMALKWFKEALPLLEKAISLKPTDGAAMEQAASAALELGDLAKATEMYRKYLALPKSDKHAEYAYKVAELLLKQKDQKGARTQYEANMKTYAQDIRNYERCGKLCIDTKDWDCAQAVLEAGVALPTATITIKQMLAGLYDRLGMQDKALAQYGKYLSEAPKDSTALLNTATLYYNKREFDKVVDLAKKAHALMPQNFESAFMLGDSYMKLGKTQDAIQAFLEARRIKATDKDVLSSLAKCYASLNDTKNLIPILREWMFVDESNVDVKAQLGRALLEQHNTSEATRLLESVSRDRPQDVEIHRTLAKIYESTGDEDSFIRHLKEALQYADKKADIYYDLGRYYLRKKRRDLSTEYMSKAVEANPGLTVAHYEYAQLLRESGNTMQAYAEAQKVVELDPYNPQYLTLFSQVAYQMNKLDVANDAVLRAIDADSTNVPALSWAGFLNNLARNTEQAKPYLDRAIKRDPNCGLCHEYMGDLHMYEGRYAKAAEHFEKSLAVRAYSEATSLKLAKAVLLSGQAEKAGLLFEKILNMNPENDEALYWLSHVYVTLGRAAEAQNLPKTYKFTKKTGWIHLATGEVYEAQENINAALISFSVAARLMPDEPRTLAATGRMHLAKREFENAVEFIGKALGQDPHNPQYLLELGKAYEGLTDYTSAQQIYEEVMRTSPHIIEAYFWSARTFSKSGDHAKAIDMLIKALERNPADVKIRTALGHEYRAANQFPKAIKAYEEASKIPGPQGVDALRFIGIVYYENMKDNDKARKFFERYQKAGGTDAKVLELMSKLPQ